MTLSPKLCIISYSLVYIIGITYTVHRLLLLLSAQNDISGIKNNAHFADARDAAAERPAAAARRGRRERGTGMPARRAVSGR